VTQYKRKENSTVEWYWLSQYGTLSTLRLHCDHNKRHKLQN